MAPVNVFYKKTERERSLTPQTPTTARNSSGSPGTWAIFGCLARGVSKELARKQRWESDPGTRMGKRAAGLHAKDPPLNGASEILRKDLDTVRGH